MPRELSTYELELIDKYLLGRLEGDGLNDFNKKLNDPDFKEAYNYQRDISLAFEAKEDQRKKDFLIHLEKSNSNDSKKKQYWKIWFPLLFISVICVGAYLYFNTENPAQNQQRIFADNFSPYTNVVLPSVRSNGSLNDLEKAFLFYDQGKYNEAEYIFENIELDTLKSEIIFYTAVSELAQDKTEESIIHFNQINKGDNYYPHSLWYRALIKIKNETSGAKELLEELLTFDNPPFKKKAEKILENL